MPDTTLDANILNRVERLEQAVEAIQQRLKLEPPAPVTTEPPPEPVAEPSEPTFSLEKPAKPVPVAAAETPVKVRAEAAPTPTASESSAAARFFAEWTDTEFLLNRLGIGLLLLGVAFLFKFAVDQGWLTPPVRLGIGYLIGFTLLGFSLRLSEKRPQFSQVLAGGAIGSFYITTFAGYVFLEILPYGISLWLMSMTTLLAYGLAVWQRRPIMAYIGLMGGLATPFVLPTDSSSVAGLLTYSSLVITAGLAIYVSLGWRWLLGLASVGGWLVYLIAYFTSFALFGGGFTNEVALQWGLIFNWAAFGIVPVVRTVLDIQAAQTDEDRRVPWYILTYLVGTPLLALTLTTSLWSEPSDAVWGGIWLTLAAAYFGGGYLLTQLAPRSLGHASYLVSSVFLTGALGFFFDGNARLIAFTVEAVGLQLLAMRWRYHAVSIISHLLVFGLSLQFLISLEERASETAFLNAQTVANLLFFAGMVVIARVMTLKPLEIGYHVVAHGFTMLLIAREFSAFATVNYPAHWIALSWSGLAWIVFALGVWRQKPWLKYQGGAAILLAHLLLITTDVILDLTWTHPLFLLTVAQTVVIALLARREQNTILEAMAHLAAVGLVGWLLIRFGLYDDAVAYVDVAALVHLAAIITLAGLAWWQQQKEGQMAYGLAAHGAMLLWLAIEPQPFDNTQGIISASWAVYAVGLLVAGLWLDERLLRYLGMGTILLVIGKLFLVDLADVSAIWRILLFLGFGTVLLVVSYFVRVLWRPRESTSDSVA